MDNAVDTLVGLIEPVMIVVLGGAVGVLLVSILGPIYNITRGYRFGSYPHFLYLLAF